MLRLKPDWQNILTKAWSIRFILAAAFFSGAETVITFFPDTIPLSQGWMASVAFLCTAFALVSRIIAQRNLFS